MTKLYHTTDMCYSNDGDVIGDRVQRTIEEFIDLQIKRAETSISGFEFCLSDRPLQSFGLIIDTTVTRLFSHDVDSKYDESGVRTIPDWMYEGDKVYNEALDIDLNNESEVYNWIKEEAPKLRHPKPDPLTYAEVFGRGGKIVGVYLSPDVTGKIPERSKVVAEALAKHFNVEVVEACRYTSIFN